MQHPLLHIFPSLLLKFSYSSSSLLVSSFFFGRPTLPEASRYVLILKSIQAIFRSLAYTLSPWTQVSHQLICCISAMIFLQIWYNSLLIFFQSAHFLRSHSFTASCWACTCISRSNFILRAEQIRSPRRFITSLASDSVDMALLSNFKLVLLTIISRYWMRMMTKVHRIPKAAPPHIRYSMLACKLVRQRYMPAMSKMANVNILKRVILSLIDFSDAFLYWYCSLSLLFQFSESLIMLSMCEKRLSQVFLPRTKQITTTESAIAGSKYYQLESFMNSLWILRRKCCSSWRMCCIGQYYQRVAHRAQKYAQVLYGTIHDQRLLFFCWVLSMFSQAQTRYTSLLSFVFVMQSELQSTNFTRIRSDSPSFP